MLIQAVSSGFDGRDYARITINDAQVPVKENHTGNYRGLHIVIINPENGHISFAGVFDTYTSSEHLEKFIAHDVPRNHIIVAACKDECVKNLSQTCKMWLSDMGSKEIWNLEYRCSYAFIGISGKQKAIEQRSTFSIKEALVTQIFYINDKVQ